MIQIVETAAVTGLDVWRVRVEVSITRGTPMIQIVGLAHGAIREGRERIRAAVSQLGLHVPGLRITVNLAPADIPKEGSAFDLPITLGILAAAGEVPRERLGQTVVVGELGLDGTLRSVRGVLPMALHAANAPDVRRLIVPEDNAAEARVAHELEVVGAASLGEVIEFLRDGVMPNRGMVRPNPETRAAVRRAPDLSTVRGQAAARRALEIAAAGGHNLLLCGPPGAGKTSLARCLPGILPELGQTEAVEATAVHSVAGALAPGTGLLTERPFRAPHHSISQAGLIGGGGIPRPGEASLAHRGVLFLDELPEFGRGALESLRQPLEEGMVSIVRARAHARFPARFALVAAMNPCPCGRRLDRDPECTCSDATILNYQRRISGPLLDRIDLHVTVPPVTWGELASPAAESSAVVRERVLAARERHRDRGVTGTADPLNDAMLGRESVELLRVATDRLGLSARGVHRAVRVARTIACLEGSDGIDSEHIAEAIRYRALHAG